MGVDEHILKGVKGRSVPFFDEDKLAPLHFSRPDVPSPSMAVKPAVAEGSSSFKELRSELRRLTSSINELLQVFSRAHEDIRAEPTAELAQKMEKLVEQNEEIGRALLLLLELHREHLPQISKHTRLSSEMRFRRPPAQLFSERFGKK